MVIAEGVSVVDRNFPVKLGRANLDELPEFARPSGFALRWYQPGDETHWLHIQLAADKLNEITPDLFQKQFAAGGERGLSASAAGRRQPVSSTEEFHKLSERQCYLLAPTGEVIGTGTAWFNDNFEGASWGRVHWMAVLPEFQGQGLGKVLMSAICRRLRELGHPRAYLTTSTARVSAINLYLRFGFAPMIRNDEEDAVWRELRPHLKFAWPPGE